MVHTLGVAEKVFPIYYFSIGIRFDTAHFETVEAVFLRLTVQFGMNRAHSSFPSTLLCGCVLFHFCKFVENVALVYINTSSK
jgi:hypothetical protein